VEEIRLCLDEHPEVNQEFLGKMSRKGSLKEIRRLRGFLFTWVSIPMLASSPYAVLIAALISFEDCFPLPPSDTSL
jgi:hypothetical protein